MSPSPQTTKPTSRPDRFFWYCLTLTLFFCVGMVYFSEQIKNHLDYEVRSPEEYALMRVVQFKPNPILNMGEKAVFNGLLLMMILMIAATVQAAWKRKFMRVFTGCMVLVAVIPGSCIATIVLDTPWHVVGPVSGPDGSDYYFLACSNMQYKPICLGQLNFEDDERREFRILGETNGDWPRDYVVVLRPATATSQNNQELWLTPDKKLLCATAYANYCYYAFCFETRQFIAHGLITDVSPFALIGPSDSLNTKDVIELRKTVDGTITHPYYPSDEQLTVGLQHPNPAVRKLAAELLARKQSAEIQNN